MKAYEALAVPLKAGDDVVRTDGEFLKTVTTRGFPSPRKFVEQFQKERAMFGFGRPKTPDTAEVVEARRQALRSAVRVYITYGAGVYLVLVSGGLIPAAFLE